MFRTVGSQLRALAGAVPRWLLIPAILFVFTAAGHALVDFARLEYHYRAALAALERESFDEAGEHLALCHRLAPESGRVYFLAAQVARRSGQYDAAREKLEISEELGWPVDPVRHEELLLAGERGDLDPGVERYLRSCLTPTNPDRGQVLEALAQGYMRTYRLAAALTCLDQWLAESPDSPGARLRRAWVYERLERPADAQADYRGILERDPDHRTARLRLAQLLRLQGKPDEALPLFQRLHDERPTDYPAAVGLAQCQLALGHADEAQPLLDDLQRRRPHDAAILLERGRLLLGAGRVQEARNTLEHAARAAPQDREARYQLFLCLRRLGENDAAREQEQRFKAIEADLKKMSELTEQLQKEPGNLELRVQIATIFLARGEEKEGVFWLQGVLRLDPAHAEVHRLLTAHYERSGSYVLARKHREILAHMTGR